MTKIHTHKNNRQTYSSVYLKVYIVREQTEDKIFCTKWQRAFPDFNLLTPAIIFHILRSHELRKHKQKKQAVGSTQRLLQYCQLADKDSCSISSNIRNILQSFKTFIYSTNLMESLQMSWLGNWRKPSSGPSPESILHHLSPFFWKSYS